MKIIYFIVIVTRSLKRGYGVVYHTLDQLLDLSDVVSMSSIYSGD
jgi:hypothetical protein